MGSENPGEDFLDQAALACWAGLEQRVHLKHWALVALSRVA